MDQARSGTALLLTIPGIKQRVAEVIIAETGADMRRFPAAAQLASWRVAQAHARRLVRQLERLGHDVILEPLEAAASSLRPLSSQTGRGQSPHS